MENLYVESFILKKENQADEGLKTPESHNKNSKAALTDKPVSSYVQDLIQQIDDFTSDNEYLKKRVAQISNEMEEGNPDQAVALLEELEEFLDIELNAKPR